MPPSARTATANSRTVILAMTNEPTARVMSPRIGTAVPSPQASTERATTPGSPVRRGISLRSAVVTARRSSRSVSR
ncbi:hypothetical protein ACFQY7_08640 [Actinomadura luteofluorescens]|uniref:hypothetical protein n=1 Tax=Actinomadura luteofluorescens TaxID=46163 RepID=UPI003639C409